MDLIRVFRDQRAHGPDSVLGFVVVSESNFKLKETNPFFGKGHCQESVFLIKYILFSFRDGSLRVFVEFF